MYHRYERMSREAMMAVQQQAAQLRLARLAQTPRGETEHRRRLFAALRRSSHALTQAWRSGLARPASR